MSSLHLPLDALEFGGPVFGGHEEAASPRGINVQPDAVLLADV